MDLESTILNYLREKEFFGKISPFLEDAMFSEEGRIILSSIRELMDRCKEDEKITCKEIHLYLSSDSSYDKKKLLEYKKFLKEIRRSRISSREVLLGICKEFIEKNIWKDSLEKFLPFLSKKGILPLDPIEEALETTRKMRESFGAAKGYDYSENISRAQVRDNPKLVETPLKGISLYPGEVGIWGGIPKRGKTWALVNTCYTALVNGKSVLYFTLEISADWVAMRLDGRVLNKPYLEIKPEDSVRAIKKIQSFGGSLVIEDRPELTLIEVRNYLKMKKFDLIIIDYADLMTSPRKFKEKRFELLAIFQGIRRIAKEFSVPIWTASQLRAKSEFQAIATIGDLEEAKIAKSGTAALVLTINQTPEEKEEGIARVFVAASSRGVKGKSIRKVEADFDTMTLKELDVKGKGGREI